MSASRKPRARANGEGSIYENGRGRFVAEAVIGWKPDGRPERVRKTFDTKADARKWLGDLRATIAEGLAPPDDKQTVGQWVDAWLATLPGKVSDGTLDAYRRRQRLYIAPMLGSVPLRKLTPSRVAQWLTEMQGAKGLSPATAQGAYSTLRRALTVAQQDGLVTRNAAAIADGPRSRDKESRWLTPAEVGALLTAARQPEPVRGRPLNTGRLIVAITVFAGTGLRIGELLALRWSDIDLAADSPTLTVRQTLSNVTGKGLVFGDTKTRRSERTLPLAPSVVDALRAHRKVQAAERLAAGALWMDHDLVIATEIGTPVAPRSLARSLTRLAGRAKLDGVHAHAFRHGALSAMLANGAPLEVVSSYAGHSSVRVTADIYAHREVAHLQVAADAIERALRGTA